MNKPVLQGINQASTFTGFCAKHDNDIFRPLEVKNFVGTPEQCFLVGYRAIARELYFKIGADRFVPTIKSVDKGREFVDQLMIQNFIQEYELGVRVGIRDLRHYKSIYDSILTEQHFEAVRGYVIEFAEPPPVMCSGAIFPDRDFNGVKLQDLGELPSMLDQMSFSSFFGGEYGVVVFNWLAEHGRACQKLIDSLKLIPNDSVIHALLNFFFAYCENILIAPDWWDGLNDGPKKDLAKWGSLLPGMMEIPLEDIFNRDDTLHTQLTVVNRYEIPN
ncbi:MAG: hypothetical protein OXI63_11125 [Candidatus Poribacteria bacterium]|nr:hypothetical protein [Gammaproteobacteria bacterium]MDE0683458.1 hypothetical protein [Candidatus Poribacteria bacterium]